jgi:subtilisin family serine protease
VVSFDTMKRALIVALGLLFVAAPAPAGVLLVTERPDAGAAPGARRAPPLSPRALDAAGLVTIEPLFAGHTAPDDPLARFWVARVADGVDVEEAARLVRALPGAPVVEFDRTAPLAACPPDDPYFTHAAVDSAQWWLHDNPAGPDLNALAAWNVTPGDRSVVLAVLDSGVDWRHPDFGPPLSAAGQIWFNAAEVNGIPGVDDDGNGFVDDVRGWDFVDVSTIPGETGRVDPAEDGLEPDNDPSDYDGHGTFVAGLAGAAANDGVGMTGVAPGVSIMPLRVGWRENYINPGNGRPVVQGVVGMAFCAQAIVYAADNGARVLNCSWLSDETEALKAALDYAIGEKGVVVVDAAGNGGLSNSQAANYLSRRGDCIEVAALQKSGELSGVTSIGTWVDISAPGERLLSLVKTGGSRLYRINVPGATSFAAPLVAGTAALLLSQRPELTPAEVRAHLMATAASIDHIGLNGNPLYLGKLGAGLVDPAAALGADAGQRTAAAPAPLVAEPLLTDDGTWLSVDEFRERRAWGHFGDAVPARVPLDGTISGMAAARLSDGSRVEAFTLRRGHVALLDDAGAFRPGWPRPTGGLLLANPLLVDIGGDADPEVVACGTDSLVYAWSLDGSLKSGFPVRVPGAVLSPPSAGDVDNDGQVELVVVTAFDEVVVIEGSGATRPWGDGLTLFPVGIAAHTPALVDVSGDGRLDLVLQDAAESWTLMGRPPGASLGEVVRTVYGTTAIGRSAFADLDASGGVDAVTLHDDGVLRVRSGGVGPRLAIPLEGTPAGGVVVTLVAEATPALLVPTVEGCLLGFDGQGAPLPGYPKRFDAGFTGRFAADVAGTLDGVMSRIVLETDAGTFQELSLPVVGQGDFAAPWGMDGGTAARTRSIPPSVAAGPRPPDDDDPAASPVPAGLRPLAQPARAGSHVLFALTGAPAPLRLEVFDVQGRRLVDRGLPAADVADGRIAWDGRADDGRVPAAGLYLVRVTRDAAPALTTRLVLVP